MALGLSRDSMCNLTALVHSSDEKDGGLSKNEFDYLSGDEGDSDEVALGMDVENDEDQGRKNIIRNNNAGSNAIPNKNGKNQTKRQTSSVPSTDRKNEPSEKMNNKVNLPASSYGKYTGFNTNAYDDDYTSFDPYAPLTTKPANQQQNDAWCFPWSGESQEQPDSHSKSSDDAYYDDYTGYDPYAPIPFGGEKKDSVFCCLFPWATSKSHLENTPRPELSEAKKQQTSLETTEAISTKEGSSKSLNRDDDECSTGSEMLGEKLTDKDRLALLARLRLSEPEGTTDGGSAASMKKEDAEESSGKAPLKGILKRCSSARNTRDVNETSKQNGRRALFPVYEAKSKKKEDNRNVQFAPMARVVTVKSQKNMTHLEKASIWWQKKDFDDFKRTGRLVAKAMLQGGSEVWLMTNPSWRHLGKSTKELHQSATKASNEKDVSNKWWHKFGHSRRGLEHIASIDEGKQRQINVKVAVRAVLDEQRKQRIHRKVDAERIRSVYHQYNMWGRELSLAAGASDAEAVQSNFCESRKSREFYIEHHREKEGRSMPSHVPDFMKPSDKNVTSQMLDANTVSQIRLRRNPVQKQPVHESQIRDADSIAKKAAGFGTGDEHVNMSAVLSGMGAVADKA
eukprot:CAMPEP_0195285670 /NCGR_PEP_ID=MMETSP0707-20130614/3415_1 /TAXON_ID=33640 /ORGANISM="Asterionellopsis glacialis, Strain CCMP134" /LENGTH=623 /DNA_ID=CAMNT_0040345195 /DNA_START=31 /DNA_END=1898 /DNA_ORIENTATION=+